MTPPLSTGRERRVKQSYPIDPGVPSTGPYYWRENEDESVAEERSGTDRRVANYRALVQLWWLARSDDVAMTDLILALRHKDDLHNQTEHLDCDVPNCTCGCNTCASFATLRRDGGGE